MSDSGWINQQKSLLSHALCFTHFQIVVTHIYRWIHSCLSYNENIISTPPINKTQPSVRIYCSLKLIFLSKLIFPHVRWNFALSQSFRMSYCLVLANQKQHVEWMLEAILWVRSLQANQRWLYMWRLMGNDCRATSTYPVIYSPSFYFPSLWPHTKTSAGCVMPEKVIETERERGCK